MTAIFYLKYSTSFGETLFLTGNDSIFGNGELENALPLIYLDNDFWYIQIEIDSPELNYHYILKDKNGVFIIEGEKNRRIGNINSITVIDTWNHAGDPKNVFYTQPFTDVLLKHRNENKHVDHSGSDYTEFRVKCPLLNDDETVCVIGQGKLLGNWATEKPLLLTLTGQWYVIRLDLALEIFPLKYKYGIYNKKLHSFRNFEEGENRFLNKPLLNQYGLSIIHDGFVKYTSFWKGSGVAIPIFSLRSRESFGTGEFTDLKLLVDWAKKTGIRLVQLLPVNDTTANHTEQDSYPYAAISAFALNPLYINLNKIGGKECKAVLKEYKEQQTQLNTLPDLDYGQVMKLKYAILLLLYNLEKDKLAKDLKYAAFVEENQCWLKGYAAFCTLRDKYGSADYNTWEYNSIYDASAVDKMFLTSEVNSLHFYYFIQYHLHLQLKEAVNYAHKNGIVIKGDIPIGVFRNGCDSWMLPELFRMDQQSGAPPDDFAIKGQNWGFPTYNWRRMQEDDFSWWKKRFEQMNRYFDAFRIDHILGFFRIWSIPMTAVEGILGKFQPAVPVSKYELFQKGIQFDESRFCLPYITDDILSGLFGEGKELIKETFLESDQNGLYHFKSTFNTQRKIDDHFKLNSTLNSFKQQLFDLHSNVIFLSDDNDPNSFHFRIAMEKTTSFALLDEYTRQQLKGLYIDYFYKRQDDLWRREAMKKLPILKADTDMLICGEDLGMVPACVPEVMDQLGILSLEIQRMPKDPAIEFFHPKDAPYMSVVTPSTHDMSTIRGWWLEDKEKIQRFYHYMLGHYGNAPEQCTGIINKEILIQHLYSPAMWAVFQLQDILGMDEKQRRADPAEERINQPADSNHYWRYRMHIFLEHLLKEDEFNNTLKDLINKSGR